jgi:hypothetical protein
VQTSQVLLLDADFAPSESLLQVAKAGVPGLTDDQLLIIQAFTTKTSSACLAHPLQSKADLQGAVESAGGDCVVKPYGPFLGAQTNYRKWWTATDSYEVKPLLDSEPYFISTTASALSFDERFVGYGADKEEQWLRTCCQGRKLMVSAEHYVLHVTHGHGHASWCAATLCDPLSP